MSFRSIFLATVALAISVPLAAQIPAPAPTPASDTPKPKKPRQICRDEGSTGSHFVKRSCHSAAEWADIDAAQATGPQRIGTGSSQR